MLKSSTLFETKLPDSFMGGKLSKPQLKSLEELSSSKFFSQILEHIEANEDRWISLMDHSTAES